LDDEAAGQLVLDHYEKHLEPCDRLHGVRPVRGKPQELSSLEVVRIRGDRDLGIALDDQHESIEGCRVLAESLTCIKSERLDRPARLLNRGGARDPPVIVWSKDFERCATARSSACRRVLMRFPLSRPRRTT
jgi:hypothetical protein